MLRIFRSGAQRHEPAEKGCLPAAVRSAATIFSPVDSGH